MGSLRRLVPPMLFRNPSFPSSLLLPRPAFLHSGLENETVVKSICNSLRVGCNWDSLSEKFGSIGFNDSLVRRILLELREPADAKRALGFFHWSAAQKRANLVHGVYSYCIMVHILVGARLITDARALLESVLKRTEHDSESRFEVVDSLLDSYRVVAVSNPLVFNLLVQGYAKLRMLDIGFEVCCYLEDHGFALTLITYNTLLHLVQKSHEIELLWKVYERMICRRMYPDEATIRTMIDGLCKEGKLQELMAVLERINGGKRCSNSCSPLMIVCTGLVLRILEEGRVEVGMGLLRLMLQKNMMMDTVAFSLIVHAKVKLGDLSAAVEVFDEMLKRGFDANSFCYTSFVEGYCESGRVEEAMNLLQEMGRNGLRPYRETFEHILLGCARTGRVKESLVYCSEMMSMGHLPSLSAYNEVLAGLNEPIDTNRANEILTCMMDKGFLPDEITYSRLMAAYAKDGKVEQVLKLYYEMEYRAISPGESGFGSLIGSLCRFGRVEEAGRLLKVMKDRGVRPGKDVYEALIRSHLDQGNEGIAAQLRKEMVFLQEV